MQNNLYPFKFEPILKERIWGGTKLQTVLNKSISSNKTGESWELSTVTGDVSVAANGDFSGTSLNSLINDYPEALLGTAVYKRFGKQFPLLFKYLDAKEDLSIQVHPNDELAKVRHQSFGKTEMWYIMQADPESRIIVGFKEESNAKEYLDHLANKTVLNILQEVEVQAGDAFFIETGTVHAIGAGIVLAEIQQTSDITYRIYDFDRRDDSGNTRELHVDLALEAINYTKADTQASYTKTANEANTIVDCPYFTTNYIPLSASTKISTDASTFRVYMCVEGAFDIQIASENYHFEKGDTVLIPACIRDFDLSGKASLLEIYIK